MLSYLRRLFGPEHLAPMPTMHPGGDGGVVNVGTPGQPTTPTIPVPTTPIAVLPPSPPSTNRVQTVGPTIAIVNISSVVTDADLAAAVAAFQIQVDRDFAPAWNTCANLVAVPTGQAVPGGTWVLYVMDTSDQAGALGYHDLTAEGNPLGKVFAKDDATYNLSWTVTASHELCLTGDTKIALLNGTSVAIQDLVGLEQFAVYSCDEAGNIKPGKGHSARKTMENAPIVKITLDNGEFIRCTANERFLMRDGSYRNADELVSGMSMMPLYRHQERIDPDKKTSSKFEYEQVYNPGSDDWLFTHRIVQPHCPSGSVRHHVDFNRFNNSPDNIEIMEWEAHRTLHARHIRFYADRFDASGQKRNISDETRAMWAKNGAEAFRAYNGSEKHLTDLAAYWTDEARAERSRFFQQYGTSEENIARLTELNQTDAARERARNAITNYNKSDAHRAIVQELGRKMFTALWEDEEFRAKKIKSQSEGATARWADPEFRTKMALGRHKRNHTTNSSAKCQFCRAASESQNHKVVSVEECGFADVYDFTVEEYHNFALDSGVFVHNCEMLADPYIQNAVFAQLTNTTGTLYALEVADACLTGDTMIPLLDGTSHRIDELVNCDEFYVYSADSNGSIKPGRGHSARRTRIKAEIVEVVLDNGKTFRCTPNHLVMCRNGSYKMASELIAGESLMPLYKRKHPISKNSKYDYEQVFNNKTNKWNFTHRLGDVHCPKGSVRHHKDFNRFNNCPKNIEILGWEEHQKVHQEAIRYVSSLPQTTAARSRNMKIENERHRGKARPAICVPHNVSAEERIRSGERGREQLLAYNGSEAHLNVIRGNQNLKKQWEDPRFRAAHAASSRSQLVTMNQTQKHRHMLEEVHNTEAFKQAASENSRLQNHKRWHLARSKPSPHCTLCVEAGMINHKVKAINYVDHADVYDITVDQYHNFAIESGVFVHNCQDDSFGYLIDGVLVSDFVFPAWFESFRSANSSQFDYTNVITSPLTLAKGGYIGVFAVPSSSGWGQRLADATPPSRLIVRGAYSRLKRRGAMPLIA